MSTPTLLDYGTSGYHGLSYSRRSTLHSCARKFQIENALGLKERVDSVTFSYGHAVAAGVQDYFLHGDLQSAVFACVRHYTVAWDDIGTASEHKGKKSIWYAIHAVAEFVRQYRSALANGLATLRDYELAKAGDKAAIELQFRILLDNDFVYEGHIDLVVVHKRTGNYAILELKTTTFREPHDAQYAKSDQALSYSIVLDAVVGHQQASYKVFYLIYSSSAQQWILKEFNKEARLRLNWINNLIRDCEWISYLQTSAEQDGIPYPANGGSCYNFFRECEYFRTCEMEDSSLELLYGKIQGNAQSFDYTDKADFIFTIDEVISMQISRIESDTGALIDYTTEDNNDGTIIEV